MQKETNKSVSKLTSVLWTIGIILGVVAVYLLGLQHGFMQTATTFIEKDCNSLGFKEAYPYGCQFKNNSNICWIMHCPLNHQAALCAYRNTTVENIGLWSQIQSNVLSIGVFGCVGNLVSTKTIGNLTGVWEYS